MTELDRQVPGPLSRRGFLRASAAGAAGIAAWSVLGTGDADAAPARGPASRAVAFDTGWLFGGPAIAGSDQPGFDDAAFSTIVLPHTVTPLSWRDWDPGTWEKVWIYRKHFDLDPAAAGLRIFVDFAAAMTGSSLTLNGHALPGRLGGYLPFSREVTDQLMVRGNVLAVTLDSRFNLDVPPDRPAPYADTSVDFWQPGGIYRGVTLRAVPQVFLADVFAKPVDVLTTGRRVDVECTLDAAVVPQGPMRLDIELREGQRTIAASSVPVSLDKPGQTQVAATLSGLADIRLWELGAPQLYDIVATLRVEGQPLHDYRTRIGFRETRFALDGFFLNGHRVKLFGVNRHQFYPYAGGAMPDRVQRKDAEILRSDLNCNMVRCSHYPQTESFYDACDELGLMAWEEAPGWGYLGDDAWKALAYRDVGDMVRRDRNHPSIIIWGARLNETPDDVPFYTSTRDLAHSLDDSRPTVGAMAGRHNTPNYVQDVFSQNDYSRSTGSNGEQQPELLPPRTDRPYMVSETVGALSGPARYYRRTDSQDAQQGQATAHGRVHNIGASDDRYCGILPWSGYDYPSGQGNQYQGVKYTGVVDLFRVPKPGAAIYQSQVDPKTRPVIQPAFYWDFGPNSPVTSLGARAMVCANLDRLEVYVGGVHHATVTPDTADYGHLPYPPSFVDFSTVDGSSHPELRIDGYLGASRVASRSFASDPSTDVLSVVADDSSIVADGSDATRVVFRAVDKYGQPRPYVGGDVQISVHGPGVLVGEKTFAFGDSGGVGAVWIRSVYHAPGQVTVRVSHDVLGAGEVTIQVEQSTPGGPPAPYATVDVQPSPSLVAPGDSTVVTASFTEVSTAPARQVQLNIDVPSGWGATAQTPTTFDTVPADHTVQARWLVTVPQDASPGEETVTVRATFTGAAQQRGSTQGAAQLFVPYTSLAAAFDNTGISDNSSVATADFDGVGNSYSEQALTAAGLAPGARVAHSGITFTWPDVPAGRPDNALAGGETVAVSGSGSMLGFLGASSRGNNGGAGTLHYTDGSTSTFQATLGDSFSPAPPGEDQIAHMTYLNDSRGRTTGGVPGQRQHDVYVFFTAVPLTAGKEIAAVTLPDISSTVSGGAPAMHVFAVAVG